MTKPTHPSDPLTVYKESQLNLEVMIYDLIEWHTLLPFDRRKRLLADIMKHVAPAIDRGIVDELEKLKDANHQEIMARYMYLKAFLAAPKKGTNEDPK